MRSTITDYQFPRFTTVKPLPNRLSFDEAEPIEFTRFRAPRSDRKRSPVTRERDLQKYAARQAKAGRSYRELEYIAKHLGRA